MNDVSAAVDNGPLTKENTVGSGPGHGGYSTRFYLVALSLLLILPVLAIAAYVTYRYVESEQRRFEQQAIALARQGALAIESEIRGITVAAELLAETQALADGDLASFYQRALVVAAREKVNITLRDRQSRQLVNSGVIWGQPLPNRSRLVDYDRQVLRTGKPAVSDFFVGIVDQAPYAAVVVPVRRDGEIVYLLSWSFKTDGLRRSFEQLIPPGWRGTVIDRKGVYILRSGDPKATGEKAKDSFVQAARAGETFWRGIGRDGTDTVRGIGRTNFGWFIGAGGPYAAFNAELNRTLAMLGLGATALLLAALAGAIAMARRIGGPLAQISSLAGKMGQGMAFAYDLSENAEVNAVARALAGASDELRRGQETLRRQAEEWKVILETVPAGVWFTRDRDAARVESTASGARMIRVSQQDNPSLTAPEGERPTHLTIYRGGAEVTEPETLPLQRAARGENTQNEELELRYTDGTTQFLLFNAAPLRDPDGAVMGAVGAAIDITERKRAETLSLEQAKILELLVSGAKQDECLAALTAALGRLQPGLRAAILLADVERKTFAGANAAEIPESFTQAVEGAPIGEMALGTCGAAVFSGEPVASTDIASDDRWAPQWRDLCLAHGIRACHSIPITATGQCFGSLMLCFGEPRQASAWELRIAATGVHLAGLIIERRRTMRALRESEEQMRLIADAMPALITYIGADERYRFVNQTYERWFGYRRGEIEGKPVREVMGEAAYAVVKPHVDAVLGGKQVSFTARVPYRDGKTRDVEATYVPARDASGAILGFYAFVNDISERTRFERALTQAAADADKAAAERALILGQLAEGVIVTDPQGNITFVNEAAERIHGVARLDVPPEDYSDTYRLFTEDGRPYPPHELPLARAVLKDETVHEETWRIRRADGSEVMAVGSASPVRTAAGEKIGAVLTLRDETKRKEAEDKRLLLIHELNHRVKNTLATIQSIAAQTLRGAKVDTATREMLEARIFTLARAHDILTRENWSGADLSEVAGRALAPFDGEPDTIAIEGATLRLPPKPALALAMALHELATNAAKYGALSRPKGRVSLEWAVKKIKGEKRLKLTWQESGGPPVNPPEHKGFGTRLIERGLAAEFDGKVTMDYRKTGLVCTLDAPLPTLRGKEGDIVPY